MEVKTEKPSQPNKLSYLQVLKGLNPPPVSETTGQGAFGIRGLEFEGSNNGLGTIKF